MNFRSILLAGAASWFLLTSPAAGAGETQRVVLPLADASKPADIEVSLMAGSIQVEAWEGKDVVLETRPAETGAEDRDDEDEEDAPPPGMKRLTNNSSALDITQEGNRVEVGGESWNANVDVLLKVPRRSNLKLGTINGGDVSVRDVEGTLELSNTNGDIKVENVAGSVVAQTVNGDLKVTLRRLDGNLPMSFASFNGNVDVTLPAALKAEVKLRADMGDIFTDFDVVMTENSPEVKEEREGKRRRVRIEKDLRGTIGGGGPVLELRTFNGTIYLRKAK